MLITIESNDKAGNGRQQEAEGDLFPGEVKWHVSSLADYAVSLSKISLHDSPGMIPAYTSLDAVETVVADRKSLRFSGAYCR